MSGFGRGVQRLSYGLNLLAGCFLAGMTALTCADVILRIFRRPILGSYEIVEFMGATAAGFALAYTTLKRGHVSVSILVALFSKRVQTIIYLIVQLVSISLFALLSWECSCPFIRCFTVWPSLLLLSAWSNVPIFGVS
jgi:TRAP-type C4-dicarboxylate transport system permease small subunit